MKFIMKAILLVTFFAIQGALIAQDFVAPKGRQRDISIEARDLKPSLDGMVKQLFDVEKPWQLLNPTAPANYGSGEKNLSKDSSAGTAHQDTTLTVVGVEW